MGDLLTTAEAAARLGRSRAFILALIADGLVHGQKLRGRWYVSRRSLDAWVDGGSVNPRPGHIVSPPGRLRRDAA